MERAVSVLDAAILVVSAVEGVQSHTEAVWHILEAYHVPVLIFLNKLDREGARPDEVLAQIRARLSPAVTDLRAFQGSGTPDEPLLESLAELDEALLDRYLAGDRAPEPWIDGLSRLVMARGCFPVMAGSALLGEGIDSFLRVTRRLVRTDYEGKGLEPFSAVCFRVRHDAQRQRACFLKLLSGSLRVRNPLPGDPEGRKAPELRVYHGERWRCVEQASAGDVIAIPGMDGVRPGLVLGRGAPVPFRSEPMSAADLLWDMAAVPSFRMAEAVALLEDEDPSLSMERAGDRIGIHVMGGIQLQILQQLLRERFGYEVTFGPRRVLYRETIAAPVVGIGHYEPLRHYAEVHLRLVPGQPGSGVTFRSRVHVDDLALNWQRLIETHVFEKTHRGVLTGAPLTDVCVELLAGRVHLKHTEGGDLREATYRAIRQALMQARSVLLEPLCRFDITVPRESYGTVLGSLNAMTDTLETEPMGAEELRITGEAPYAAFSRWQDSFLPQTHGRGSLRVWASRYAPCADADEIVARADYHPLADDTPDSVFCAHGAGYTVAWYQVPEFAHIPRKSYEALLDEEDHTR